MLLDKYVVVTDGQYIDINEILRRTIIMRKQIFERNPKNHCMLLNDHPMQEKSKCLTKLPKKVVIIVHIRTFKSLFTATCLPNTMTPKTQACTSTRNLKITKPSSWVCKFLFLIQRLLLPLLVNIPKYCPFRQK